MNSNFKYRKEEGADRRIEQVEYERIATELEPVVKRLEEGASPLLQRQQIGLVLMAALIHQTARVAQRIGMGRMDFDKRVSMIADRVYAARPTVPKVIV
jgi:hypothetical protein